MGLFSAISWGVNSEILNTPVGTANKELDELVFIRYVINLKLPNCLYKG
jgi:hypothetical protein